MPKPTKKQVNEILKGSWTPRGVQFWWDRPRTQLDGRTPREAWPDDPELVYELALAGRDGGGT
jgi:hypothetical protein